MNLTFDTAMRVQYSADIATRLGYTYVVKPETHLAISFLHAATPVYVCYYHTPLHTDFTDNRRRTCRQRGCLSPSHNTIEVVPVMLKYKAQLYAIFGEINLASA